MRDKCPEIDKDYSPFDWAMCNVRVGGREKASKL
jgi:hypothetical protein